MTSESNLLQRYILLQKALHSSLRLKDVLDAAAVQFSDLAGGAKVAIFLSDNESMSFKLMAAKGFTEASLEQMRIIPFSAESLLKFVVQNRAPVSAADPSTAPDLSSVIMKREQSRGEIALPLISANLMVGAIVLEVANESILAYADFYKEVADVTALAVANSILFGRSEYERERLSTLYKTSCALSGSMLQLNDVLQIAADTALVLGNTPCCAVLLLDEDGDHFQLAAFKGLEGSSLKDYDLTVANSIAGASLRSGRAEMLADSTREPYGMPKGMGGSTFRSVVALPLMHNGRALGVLEVFSTDMQAFHREQIELLDSLAQQVANALNVALAHQSAAQNTSLDVHTGLYNRLHFEDTLRKEIERSGRHNHEFGLVLIDIDHLGQINEHLGQEKGDDAIRHVASIIKQALRDIDVASRYGGEEFAVILPETPQDHVLEVAERLRQTIRENTAPGVGTITVSIGATAFPALGENSDELLKGAEQALDIAKYEGRDRVRIVEKSSVVKPGELSWAELANQAKLSVISERQGRLQSRLTVAPEYASWLTATPSLVKRRGENEAN